MGTIKQDIIAYLLSISDLTAFVSGRIRPNRSPQGEARPRLVVSVTGIEPEHHMRGASTLAMTLVDIRCEGRSFHEATQIADICRLKLDGFRGAMNINDDVRLVRLIDWRDTEENPIAGDEVGFPSVTLRFAVHYKIAVEELIS